MAVFPLPPGGRRPAVRDWAQRCVADPDLVRRTWRPGDNVGVGCRASNVVGLDLDRRHGTDGIAAFAALCSAHGQNWPDTLTVRTPHGGLHLYFRAPAGRTVTSASGGRAGLGPGIDTRGPGRRRGGGGGYLIGPGSIVDSRPYVITRDTDILDLPSWLGDLLENHRNQPAPPAVDRVSTRLS